MESSTNPEANLDRKYQPRSEVELVLANYARKRIGRL